MNPLIKYKNKIKIVNMKELCLLIIVIWFIATLLILRFTPNDKISVMGNFFKKILSVLPISKIIESFKK